MHDPLVVAFEIPRPWPKRFKHLPDGARGGRRWYFPPIVTVWHREPNGQDAGTVCRHYRRGVCEDWVVLNGWRFHIHHWKVQIPAFQLARRRLLTRCAWCGGRSRSGDSVNVSQSWDGQRSRWWQGEPGLFHSDCSSVKRAHAECLCDQPGPLLHGDYGTCAYCGKFRVWRNHAERLIPPLMSKRMLASLPPGSRIPADMKPELERLWASERAERSGAASGEGAAT